MKQILIAVLVTAGTFGFANAQVKKKVIEPATTIHTSVSSKTQTTVPKATATPAITKKASKTAVTSKTIVAPKQVSTGSHMKSDGTPDKRYKENKTIVQHVKKDGTADMRYKTNKK